MNWGNLTDWLKITGRKHTVNQFHEAAHALEADLTPAENDRLKRFYVETSGPHDSPDPIECLILYVLARGKSSLEIGCWKGRTTCFLAEAGPVTTVDWFEGDQTGGAKPSRNEAEQSLANFGLTAEIIEADMLTVDWAFARGKQVVFYDSDHTAEPTIQVIQSLAPHLAAGTAVVFHDADHRGTRSALHDLASLFSESVYLPVWEGLQICRTR